MWRRSFAMAQSLEASPERSAQLLQTLTEIRIRVKNANQTQEPLLVAVSKYSPVSDVLACHRHGQVDFGENFVQGLVDKSKQLPPSIRWHFIGSLQSNKAKTLALIPNLHTVHTLTSLKTATLLHNALPPDRASPLNVLLQVNTSGEVSKSGLPPISADHGVSHDSELVALAKHVVLHCPKLHLQGLMTIGSLTESLSAGEKNQDFQRMTETRNFLEKILLEQLNDGGKWGHGGRLLLSMGMSNDFEAAIKLGSDIIRVGSGVFGTHSS